MQVFRILQHLKGTWPLSTASNPMQSKPFSCFPIFLHQPGSYFWYLFPPPPDLSAPHPSVPHHVSSILSPRYMSNHLLLSPLPWLQCRFIPLSLLNLPALLTDFLSSYLGPATILPKPLSSLFSCCSPSQLHLPAFGFKQHSKFPSLGPYHMLFPWT